MSTSTPISHRLFVSALAQEPELIEPEMFLSEDRPIVATVELLPKQEAVEVCSATRRTCVTDKEWL